MPSAGRRGRQLSELAGGDRTGEPGKDGDAAAAAAPDGDSQRLRLRGIVAAAGRAGLREWWRILGVAVAIALAGAALEILVDHFVDPADAALSIGATLISTGVALLGTVLLSGFVCRLVGATEHGRERLTLLRLARSLPVGRLAAADVLVTVIATIGLLLLVIPGLIALTLLAVVGPVIEIEHRQVRDAMRRSARLARRHFWGVFLLATVPLVVSGELEAIAPDPHRVSDIVWFLIVRGVVEAVMEGCIALVVAELAFQLIAAHPAPRDGPAESGGKEREPAHRPGDSQADSLPSARAVVLLLADGSHPRPCARAAVRSGGGGGARQALSMTAACPAPAACTPFPLGIP